MKKISLLISSLCVTSSAFALSTQQEVSPQTSMRLYDGVSTLQAQCVVNKYLTNPEGADARAWTIYDCGWNSHCSSSIEVSGPIIIGNTIQSFQDTVVVTNNSDGSKAVSSNLESTASSTQEATFCKVGHILVHSTFPVENCDPDVLSVCLAPVFATSFAPETGVSGEEKLKVTIKYKPNNFNNNVFWAKIDSAVESCTGAK